MSNRDDQLVQQVTEMVIDAMRRAGKLKQPQATLHPPAGTCTGDYSKFTELKQPAPGASSPIALSGFVTAQQLQDAIDAAADGKARLAPDAKLTPLANDFARQHPEKLERIGASAAVSRSSASAAQGSSFLAWASGHCPHVQKLTSDLRECLQPSGAARSDSGLIQLVHDLASGVGGKRIAGGVLFVETAALAACYVNRSSHLRGVVATSESSVQAAMDLIGANVLIVEYKTTSPEAMRRYVELFTSRQPQTSPNVQRNLADLHRS